MTRLWSLQVLRFLAALFVTYLHAENWTFVYSGHYGFGGPALGTFGRCGVDIFFVISGFIITRTARGLSVGQFLRRRAKRILPLHFLLVALLLPLALASAIGWRGLLATCLLWPATDRITDPYNPVAWTLCFEVVFYAAFALTIWRRKMVWAVLAIFLALLAARTFTTAPTVEFLGNPLILEFLAGVALAYAPPWRPAIWAIPIGAGALILGAALGWPPYGSGADFLAGHQAWLRVADLGIPAALVVWGTLQIEARQSVFTYLGDASYALYMVHFPVAIGMVILLTRFIAAPPEVAKLAATAACVLVAWPVYELFEKPAMAWLGRTRRPRIAPVAP